MKYYGIFMRGYCSYASLTQLDTHKKNTLTHSTCHRFSPTSIRLERSKFKVSIDATDNVEELLKSFRKANWKLQTVRQTF